MRIEKIDIEEFGRLTDLSLKLSKGLNLIEGKNESGKSTLLAFLRFVFYGFPRRNAPDGEERDKRLSWSGKRAAGSLTLRDGRARYRITRSLFLRGTKTREAAVEELSVVALPGGEEIDLGAKTPGEYFLGLPAELYDSSLCLAQSDAARVANAGVREAIGDLLFTDESTLCSEAAEAKLQAARRELQHVKGRGGQIARLEDELHALDDEIRGAREDAERLAVLRENAHRFKGKLERSREQADALSKAFERLEVDRGLALFEQYHRANEAQRLAAERLEEVGRAYSELPDRETAIRMAGHLRDADAAGAGLERLEAELLREQGQVYDKKLLDGASYATQKGGDEAFFAEVERQVKRPKRLALPAIVLLVLSLLLFGAAMLREGLMLPLLAAAGVCLLPSLLLAALALAARRAPAKLLGGLGLSHFKMLAPYLAQCRREQASFEAHKDRLATLSREIALQKETEEQLLGQIRAEFSRFGETVDRLSLQQMAARLEEIVRKQGRLAGELSELNLACEKARASAKTLAGQLEGLDEAELKKRSKSLPECREHPDRLTARRLLLQKSTAEWEQRIGELDRAESALAATAKDLGVLESERVRMSDELEAARARLEALLMALDALGEASEELRRGLTPRLREDAARLFAELTDGRHDALMIGSDFSLSIEDQGRILPLSRFSAGCRDAAHLSLRLALLATLSDEKLPLFFDEAFARLDDERARSLLSVLQKYGKSGGQVILFTCHTREGEMLAGDADVTVLSLGEPLTAHL